MSAWAVEAFVHRLSTVWFFAVTIACSGSRTDVQITSPDGASSVQDASTSDASTGDAAASDAAGPSPDASPASTLLWPLAVGYKWTYDVKALGTSSTCGTGSRSTEITATETLGGKPIFTATYFCAALGTITLGQDGEKILFKYGGLWLSVVDIPIEEGHTWTYGALSFTWKRETSVTVPAGTFTDCWTSKQNVSYTAYTTYCRGMGPVQSYSKDLNGNGWDARLTVKNF